MLENFSTKKKMSCAKFFFFFKNNFLKKFFQELLYQVIHYVEPNQYPNCLQWLSAATIKTPAMVLVNVANIADPDQTLS